MKLLDEKGLTTVWAAIKNTFTSKSDADGKYAEKSKALGSVNFDYTAWGLNMSTYNVDGDGCGYINITPATSKIAGVMTASDKSKLDGIAMGANNYTLPVASTNTLGGIKTGYSDNDTINWPVKVDDNNNAYVPNVSSLCKFNNVYLIKYCVSNRLNLLIPDGRKVNLDDIMDEEGIVIFAILTAPSDVTCSVGFVYNNEEDIYNQKTLSGPFLITAGGGIVNVYSL